jgi:hypothetical protein
MESDEETNRGILFAAAWRGEGDKLKEIINSGVVNVNARDENKVRVASKWMSRDGSK